ncbi:MAG: DNA-binding MarR family transcriptional regulator [Phenylobacterium sp.]|jgi:DNA-binding MarR family transcriptional regulator
MNRTVEGEALTSLLLETFRLNGTLLAAGNHLTKPFELTSARWQIMGPIFESEESMTVAQIARRMGLSRQGVQRIVNDLKALNMVVPLPNRDHKRAPLISLSEAGRDVMIKIKDVQAVWVNNLAKDFSEDQIKQALNLIETVRERADIST